MKNAVLSLAAFCTLGCSLLLAPVASAQILVSGGNYSTNFDSLATSGAANAWADNSTLLGWYAAKTLGGAITVYRAESGTGNAGALYSYGTGTATERALGSIGSGTPGNFSYGVRFTNDTSLSITNLTVSYTGEQWRNGGNTAVQSLTFSYRVSNSPITDADAAGSAGWTALSALDFVSPTVGATATALDGNAAANRHVFSGVFLTNVVVLPGQEVFLRWSDINDTGNDHGLAIDDFSFAFTTVTAVTNPVAITGQPQARTNNAGTIATFTVTATGSALNYVWRKDGSDLSDGGNIYGSTTSTLTVSNVLAADVADYSVLVTNSVNSVPSDPAHLTVLDPAINTQPASHTVLAGDTANLFISAAGTPVLSYQWRFNGVDIVDATTTSLNVTNFQSSNEGAYTVVVTNGPTDSTTSSVATVTLFSTPANRIVRWDFNNSTTTNAPEPSIGTGTASLVSGTTATLDTGTFSDPAGTGPLSGNAAWNTTTYAAQGTSNKLRGAQFNVSTVGYQHIVLTWEQRQSATASKYTRLQYSADGVNFTDGPVITVTNAGSFAFYSADLSAITSLNNNANAAFRVVQEWEATAIGNNNSNFVATTSTSAYGTSGTIRFDLFTVFGDAGATPSPIPLAIQQSGNNVILTWSDPAFSLQAAPSIDGTYTNIPGATSPHPEPITGDARFFRLKY